MTKAQSFKPSLDHILICEDDPVQGKLLEELLRAKGYGCVGPCMTASDAVSAARDAPVRAALLDVALDGGSSKEAASILKERGIPFAFITAYGPGTASTMAAYSDELIVPKPVSPDVLGDIIDTLIPAGSAE
ncbi:response regulator [Parvularcula maris]|uniref:Response regulator n=1 Tax=Parvularcula maris TaxID=2965077 RepID=A0A9X2L8T9_9PROT|nr:response regulator [Parvularcula maris]MCQ8184312.1 response regulator [Parvularcula maris]